MADICVVSTFCASVAQSCPTLCDPWTVANQVPLNIGFYMQGYWRELPVLSPVALPGPETEPRSPTMKADLLPSELPRKP